MQRSHHTEIDGEVVVEGNLSDVELGDIAFVALGLDHRVVFHHTHRSTVVSGFRSATEGDVVVLYETRALDGLAEVRVIAQVDIGSSIALACTAVFVSIHHLHTLEHLLKANAAVVGDMELLVLAFLCGHLDDTRCTTAAVLGRL